MVDATLSSKCGDEMVHRLSAGGAQMLIDGMYEVQLPVTIQFTKFKLSCTVY